MQLPLAEVLVMARPPAKTLTPRERALNLLSRREQSERELRRKLVQKGVGRDEAAEAVGALSDSSLQSNARFAGMMVRRRIADGYGPQRITAELSAHGVDRALIQQAIDEEEPDWDAQADRIYRRKFGAGPAADAKERAKRAAYLTQRGFSYDIARRIAAAAESDSD